MCSSWWKWLKEQKKRKDEQSKTTSGRIDYHLIKTGAIEESKLTDFLSKQYGVPAINLKTFDIDPEIIKLVSRQACEEHILIPVNRAGDSLILAISDPSDVVAMDAISKATGYRIEVVVASEVSIREAIDRYYRSGSPAPQGPPH